MADNSTSGALTPIKRFNQCIANTSTQEYLKAVLNNKKDSFVANVTALVTNNTQLQDCAPMSVIYAAIKATALDLPLEPSLGCAYVIPYKNNKLNRTDAQFQLGAKGLLQLAIRSGQFKLINVTDIREGEVKGYDLLTGEINIAGLPNRESLPVVGYAAFFRLVNGFEKTLYMTVAEIEAHAYRYSQTYKNDKNKGYSSSKWTDDFDAMAKKTVLKLLLAKYAPKSVEMQMVNKAIADDQVVVNENNVEQYLDNPNVEEQVTVDEQNAEVVNKAMEAAQQVEAMKQRRTRTAPKVNLEEEAANSADDMPNEMFEQ